MVWPGQCCCYRDRDYILRERRGQECPRHIRVEKGKGHALLRTWPLFNAGNDLLSHTLSRAVQSALRGLTSVFGMGTGGTPAVWSPTAASSWPGNALGL